MVGPAEVFIFGDSLTAGRLGIGYCRYLPFRYAKQGVSGSTSSAVIAMAVDFLHNHTRRNPSTLILQAGANDLLIPHMMRIDSSWTAYGVGLLNPQHPPLEEDDLYQVVLDNLFHILTESCEDRILSCSIPLLGEDPRSPLNQKRKQRDSLTKRIAARYGIGWCDLGTALTTRYGELSAADTALSYSDYLLGTPGSLDSDARSIAGDEERAWRVSQERGLLLTVDGVHPNGDGARAIASALCTSMNSSEWESKKTSR